MRENLPFEVGLATFCLVVLAAAGLTQALEIPDRGTIWLVAWSLAMTGPVLVVPVLAAKAAQAALESRRQARAVETLEATQGTLVGRVGVLERVHMGGAPLPAGHPRFQFRDGDLALLIPNPGSLPPAGSAIRITGAFSLPRELLPFTSHGVGVVVTSQDEPASG